eukprot:9484186-Pyramimonas_sp.AAC.1
MNYRRLRQGHIIIRGNGDRLTHRKKPPLSKLSEAHAAGEGLGNGARDRDRRQTQRHTKLHCV